MFISPQLCISFHYVILIFIFFHLPPNFAIFCSFKLPLSVPFYEKKKKKELHLYENIAFLNLSLQFAIYIYVLFASQA